MQTVLDKYYDNDDYDTDDDEDFEIDKTEYELYEYDEEKDEWEFVGKGQIPYYVLTKGAEEDGYAYFDMFGHDYRCKL